MPINKDLFFERISLFAERKGSAFKISDSPSGKALLFRRLLKKFWRLRRRSMFQISRTTPAYYFTVVAHHRLPIFRTDKLKQVVCDAYDEARTNHRILILAYVIMLDHVHILVYSKKEMKEALRLLNGVSARSVIQYLKENGFESSLFKLRGETRERNHKHSVWQHHPDSLEIFGEDTFRQKVEYIHMNPVKSELVKDPLDYRYSSARQWAGCAADAEPLLIDHLEIDWR